MTKTQQHRCQAHCLCALAVAIFLGATAQPLRAQEKQDPNKGPKEKPTIKAAEKQVKLQKPKQAGEANDKRQPANFKRANLRQLQATPQKGARRRTPAKASNRGVPQPTIVLKPGEVPAIKFDTPSYEFGRIRSGTDVLHDFWFTNTGTGPLEILRVKPG